MSNIGLFSTSTLTGTDLSLNGIINVIATDEYKKYTQKHTIDGFLYTSTLKQTNPIYAYFVGAGSNATISTYSGYNFTSTSNPVGLSLSQTSLYTTVGTTNGKITVPYDGYYMISIQFVFSSNTGGNIYTLNYFYPSGIQYNRYTINICQEPTTNSNPFVRSFNQVLYFNVGDSFSITLTTFVGPDVLNFGNGFQGSFIKLLKIT